MAETNAYPTEAELLLIRSDLKRYVPDGKTLTSYLQEALKEVKRALEDQRGILWTQVFDTTTDAYLVGTDSIGRNADRIKQAICLFTVALLFRNQAIISTDEGKWWGLYSEFWTLANDLIKNARLDIDTDESGAIDDGEDARIGQTFMVK